MAGDRAPPHEAERRIGAAAATAVVVAGMIGTGVFTTTGLLVRDLGSPLAVLAAWAVGGLLALCGALSYAELGVALPRTTKEQYQAFPPAEAPRPGDLVFFSFGGKEVDHVGIYLGRGVFAHASSYGSRVVIESLEAPFYRKVYRGARRVMASPEPPPAPSATP